MLVAGGGKQVVSYGLQNSPVKVIDRLTAAAQTAVTSVVGEVEGVLVRHAVDHVGELEGAALVSDEIRCNETSLT